MARRDVGRYFFFIKEEVSSHWKDLAFHLRFRWVDIDHIEDRNPDDKSRCMDLLEEWLQRNGETATIEALMKALSKAGLRMVMHGLKSRYKELGVESLTDVGRYFYLIKEAVSSDWMDLAYHLEFEQADVHNIAGRNPDDKSRCMDLLEEWRKRNGERATMEVLMEALSEANLQSVVDGLRYSFSWTELRVYERQDKYRTDSEETIEDLIGDNFTFLRRRLQVEKLIPHFIERRLLDFSDKQVIMSKTTAPGRAEALLQLLAQKGTCKPEEFVEILKEGDHRHVADQLRRKSIRNERTEERTTASLELRTPEMARLYAEACRQGSLPVHSTRVPVVGQYRAGKTCFINRLMGETVIDDPENEEPITDGINIITDVQTKGKAWKKSKEEIDDLAGPLLRTQQKTEPSAEDESKKVDTMETQEASKDTVEVDPAEQEKDRVSQGEKAQSTATTEKPKKVEDDPSPSGRSSERPESLMPEHVAENAARMIKAGITEDEIGTAEHPRLSFWDFGGQATYYGTHHCFITHRGVYILVMSLLQKLSDPVPDLDNKASVDNLRTGGDYLDHWLNTVHSHTQPHTGRPPVIIVLTRKDKVSEEYIEKYKEEILSHIKEKAAGPLVMPEIFAVDNTTEDAAVDKIRDYIREVARDLPHMGEEIPIPWLHLNSKLKTKRKEGDRFCKFQEIADLARDPDISITDRHSLALVLTFLHDRGDVIFFNEPSLRDDVTLQPQVMIDVFKTIITIPQYQEDRQTNPEVRKMWRRLEQEGVLSDELLTRIWEKKDRQLEKPFLMRHKSFLKALMEKFYLLCNAAPVGDDSDEAQQEEIYFVPALLSCERDNAKLYPGNMFICPKALYFVFREKFLPSGMFCRLQALCVRRFGLQESCVFAGCARFPTDDEEQAFIITKINHYLKVELLSSSNVFTEGLRVRKFLSSALFEIKEKWIPCIQYDLRCATREDAGGPDFLALQTDDGSVEQDPGIPSAFRAIWMNGSLTPHRTENSGGDGPVIIEPTADPRSIVGMRTIGPVLDTLELGGGLTLDQCDLTRSQLTPAERVRDMVKMVENRYQLGAAVEMCCPEFVDLFLREKRGKELVILHTGDYTDKFVLPLQTAALDAGVPCHTETITSTDTITEKTVEHLLNTINRMAILLITPDALDQKHWSHLDYEFPVRNEELLLPILLYPMHDKNKERMVRVLQQRSPVLANMERVEIQMEGRAVSETKLQEIIQKVMTDVEREFQLVLERIFSRLDETDVRLLLRVWSARTSQEESPEIENPRDLKRAMEKTGCFRTGDLVVLEKDMMAAGISFPLIVQNIPGVPDEFRNPRTTEASVGPVGAEVEIPGFVKLVVPPGALQQDTAITVSTVDVPGILRGPEGVNWISGYPWSLGKDACPRELLDQVLFSPAVDVNLHGAQLDGPVQLETWRPPGSEGMECILLKHHDGEGWMDITASTMHEIYSDKISISLHTFSPLDIVWVPMNKVITTMVNAFMSRTLNCSFAAYAKPHRENVTFHVVCRDRKVETDEYRPGFTRWGYNDAWSDLYHGDSIEVAVTVHGGKEKTELMNLRTMNCRDRNGQNVQMLLDRPAGGGCVEGEVNVKTPRAGRVCQLVFKEEEDIPDQVAPPPSGRPVEAPPGNGPDAPPGRVTDTPPGSSGTDQVPGIPTVLLIIDEYGTSKGGISTINCQVGQTLKDKAIVFSTVLRVPKQDQEAADRDKVHLIEPHRREGDKTEPSLDWLAFQFQSYYPKSKLPQHVDVIIGHASITDTAARNIKDDYYQEADLIMFTHVLPEDTEYFKGGRRAINASEKEENMVGQVDKAKAAFSVGPRIYKHFKPKYRGDKKPREHYLFLPRPSKTFEEADITPDSGDGEKSVLTIGRVNNVEHLKGYNLAARAMRIVARYLAYLRWITRGISRDDYEKSMKILEDNLNSPDLIPTLRPYGTQQDIRNDMMTAHLVLMPSRSEPFGLVGLEAIAAGIPVLISDKTGLADMIKELVCEEKLPRGFLNRIVETSVQDRDMDKNAETWALKIRETLNDTETAFNNAKTFKVALLESKYWEDSENQFLQACGIPGSAAQAQGSR